MGRRLHVAAFAALGLAAFVLAAAVIAAWPTGARGGLGDILGHAEKRLGTVILTRDVLALPGENIQLQASLRSGMGVRGVEGRHVQFHLNLERMGQLVSDGDGNVSLPWKAPAAPGDYLVRVRLKPAEQPVEEGDPVAEAQLLVAVRKPDTPLVIVDMDKTVVASGFAWVMVGKAKPMPAADLVLQRLAAGHTIVYLTHRPDFLGPTSKRWLTEYKFPLGPVLTSTMSGLMSGSGAYKTARLDAIRKSFPNVRLGIGDKISDARAYSENGLRSVLILDFDWSEDDPGDYEDMAAELASLPDDVQVVTNWAEVSAVVFDGASHPKRQMMDRLRAAARDLRTRRRD